MDGDLVIIDGELWNRDDWEQLDEGLKDWLRQAGKKVRDIFRKKPKPPPPTPPPKGPRKPPPMVLRPRPDIPPGIPKRPRPKPVDKETEREQARAAEAARKEAEKEAQKAARAKELRRKFAARTLARKFAKKIAAKRPPELDPAIEPPKVAKERPPGQGAINHSDFYRHVVRAIYNRIKATGYPTRGTPAHSSQAIARGRMIDWGYARAKTTRGGVDDERTMKLTPMGQARNIRKHAKEGSAKRRAKQADYDAIVARDPF
jgi:hypothetical protein